MVLINSSPKPTLQRMFAAFVFELEPFSGLSFSSMFIYSVSLYYIEGETLWKLPFFCTQVYFYTGSNKMGKELCSNVHIMK